jgi:phospholipid/cholesterol/gamma-HCH transport system substrate-binding protein
LTSSLLGDATLQFVQGSGHSEEYLANGDYIVGNVVGNPLDMLDVVQGDIQETISVITSAGREFRQAGQYVNQFLVSNDEQLNRIVNKAELTLDRFEKAAGEIESLFADDKMRADLREGLANVPELLKETRQAVNRLEAAAKVAENVLDNVQGFTKPLGERGDAIVRNVDEGIAQLNVLLDQFTAFSKAVNNRDSSLGKVLNDPELYQHANAAARNIERLTLELRPIIENAKVISDKLARHPGMIIRDAVKPNSGIK